MVSKIYFHASEFFNNLIYFLIVSSFYFMMKIIVKILKIRIYLFFDMLL